MKGRRSDGLAQADLRRAAPDDLDPGLRRDERMMVRRPQGEGPARDLDKTNWPHIPAFPRVSG
jgi:hypothetical protein